MIAFYQVSYGIAALGTGPLVDAGVALPAIFGASAIAALVMGALSFRVTATRRAATTG